MLKGITKTGEMKNVVLNEDGSIPVGGSEEIETTLYANIMTLNTEEQTIGINKKVTQISIANYSETADATVDIDGISFVIGANIATDLPINKTVSTIALSSTEADTKVQYVVKGVE